MLDFGLWSSPAVLQGSDRIALNGYLQLLGNLGLQSAENT